MELKHFRLLTLSLLLIHFTCAISLNDVVDQILAYPASLFQPSNDLPANPQDPNLYSSNQPEIAAKAAVFPCCICSGCICSHTSCPRIIHRPHHPPEANWPIEAGTPKFIAAAGCGGKYGLNACLTFVQQYLQALQPALEIASNHSHEYGKDVGKEKEKKKKKQPCCGDGCTDAQCLGYLATAVKNLQAPINGTLENLDDVKKPVDEKVEEMKTEL